MAKKNKNKNKATAEVTDNVEVKDEATIEVTPPETSTDDTPAEASDVGNVNMDTAEVSVPVADESTKDSDAPKQPHEEAMEQFGVNPEESYDGSGLKMIPKDWYAPIIRLAINKNGIKPVSTVPQDNLFVVVFDALDKAEEFNNTFGVPVINCINQYISEIAKDDPKAYQRALVVETQVNGTVVHIAF